MLTKIVGRELGMIKFMITKQSVKSKKYGIVVGLGIGTLVKITFPSKKEADDWAKWNYKGRSKYKIVTL